MLISTQHAPEVNQEAIRSALIEHVIRPVLPKDMVDERLKIFVNPTGRFVIGGPQGDAGVTGRKIIVDSYGGMGRHGGGAFSGKDPTRSIAQLHMPPAGQPKMLLLPDSLNVVKSRWLMPSVLLTR